MKQILVIGGRRSDINEFEPVSKYADYVGRVIGAEKHDVTVSSCHVDEVIHVLDGSSRSIRTPQGDALESFDFIWFRGPLTPALNDLAIITQYLQDKQVPFANKRYADRAAMGKLAQMHTLAKLALPYAKTVSTANDHLPALISKELAYPIILKATNAGHGHSNYLVRDETQLIELLTEEPKTQFVAQTFVPNDGDYRLLFVHDSELIIHRKGVEDSHLNNTSQGGAATLVPVSEFPSEVLAQAHRFAEACNYEIAGVDVMFNSQTGEPCFLEVNSQPQIMTGAFTDEKAQLMGEYFREQLGL